MLSKGFKGLKPRPLSKLSFWRKRKSVKKMAAKREAPDSLCCSICLDVLKKPVTLHCGHSYCMDCVNDFWDQGDHRGAYRCPQCRHTFTSRPVLNKNTVLADLMVKMTETGRNTPHGVAAASSGGVDCDFCNKLKAVKSCLVCLASYCATHVQPHYESAAFKRHKLVEVSASMQEMICCKHDKLLEVYCRTDDECICMLCVMDEHKGHDTVSAAAERKEKQKQFGQKKQKYHQGVQEKEKQLRQLRQKITALQCCRDAALDQNEKAYAEIILMADERRSAVREQIAHQEKAALGRAESLVDRFEKEIKDLKKKEDELKQLSLTEDNIYFLQHCKQILGHTEQDVTPDLNFKPLTAFDFVTKAFSDLRDKMENMAKAIGETSEKFNAGMDPKTRQEMSMYSLNLYLDPNTAFENLLLSEKNTQVTWIKKAQQYPSHPERFSKYDQVLCCEGLSGVCYWEVEWKGPRVEVAVCYKGAKLNESCFGYSDESWCVSLSKFGCTFWHNETKTEIPAPRSSRVGIYLNHKAGSLWFYGVSDSDETVLLHKVQTTFSQPLYPGFMVSRGASVKIINRL